MARSQQTDFLQGFRYHVIATAADGSSRLRPEGRPEAGFTQVSAPRLSTEAVSYKEGTMNYARKQPGAPTFDDISMSRGLARGDTTFWDWSQQTAEGGGEYRADVDVKVYHRAQALVRTAGDRRNTLNINTERPALTIHILEAFPTGTPLFGEMDASSGEIAVLELGVAYEHAWPEHHPVT